MPDIPATSGKDAVRAFEALGFTVDRISGSHHIMTKPGHKHHLSIPVHGNKTVHPGLLKGQIRLSGATNQDFIAALRQ